MSVIEHWLAGIADAHGNGAAQSARKALGNTLAHAERQGAIAASVMGRVRRPARASVRRVTASASRLARRAERWEPTDSCSERRGSTPRSGVPARLATCFADPTGAGDGWLVMGRLAHVPSHRGDLDGSQWRTAAEITNQLGHADVNTTPPVTSADVRPRREQRPS